MNFSSKCSEINSFSTSFLHSYEVLDILKNILAHSLHTQALTVAFGFHGHICPCPTFVSIPVIECLFRVLLYPNLTCPGHSFRVPFCPGPSLRHKTEIIEKSVIIGHNEIWAVKITH